MNITKATVTVVEAAKRLGIGRNSAYDAAARGEIPTIRIGKRILVPVAALERLLAGGSKIDGEAA
jgi:excisionase family DNA binding protein